MAAGRDPCVRKGTEPGRVAGEGAASGVGTQLKRMESAGYRLVTFNPFEELKGLS